MAPKDFESTFSNSMEASPERSSEKEKERPDSDPQELNFWDFWTSQPFEQMQQQMESLSGEKKVNLVDKEDTEEKLKVSFELLGLTPNDFKVSMTESNFLELEYSAQFKDESDKSKQDGSSFIWAYPLGKGYLTAEMTKHISDDGKLVVTIPKDPNYKDEDFTSDEWTAEQDDSQEQISPLKFWPFESESNQDMDISEPIQLVQPTIDETDECITVHVELDDFEPHEISVQLSSNHLLSVEGKRMNHPDGVEAKLRRKSFGRLFWIPEGCQRESISANAIKDESGLHLKIIIPKGGESYSDKEKYDRVIDVKEI